MTDAWRAATSRRIQVDLRALAALRIALGLILLADLVLRGADITAFYTDAGAVPRHAAPSAAWSFHGLSGSVHWQILLFVLHAAAATAMLVGWTTRRAAATAFVLLLSLHARNPFVLQAGDILLLFTLWWALFLPIGARWALQPARRSPEPLRADIATFALLLQPVLVYTTNLVFKARSGIWTTGEAMQYAFVDLYITPFGGQLALHPPLVAFLGQAWFVLLLLSPLLLVLTGTPRGLLAAALAAGHLGMLLTMRIGLFPVISIAALLPFVPSGWWNALRPTPAPDPAPDPTPDPAPRHVPPRRTSLHPAARTILVLAVVANVAFSAWGLGWLPLPEPLDEALEGRERAWAMFAHPPRGQTWYVATTPDGTDLFTMQATVWDHPVHLGTPPDARWRKLLSRLDDEGGHLTAPLLDHLCLRAPGTGLELVRIHLATAPDARPSTTLLQARTCPQP